MRVAMIGLGDIARKAYLPVLAARSDIELSLMSRDESKLAALSAAWRIARYHTDLNALIDSGVDAAFIHAASTAHEEIATRLLQAEIPVYIDKPMALDAAGAARLVDLAEQKGVSLMVGFNRRFAPDYAALATKPRDLIVLQKHRIAHPADCRTVIFDDFIHVVDTLRFLLPEAPQETHITLRQKDGILQHVALTLSGMASAAIGVMNRFAGANEEILEVSGRAEDGQTQRVRVSNLSEVRSARNGDESLIGRGDWTSVARQRGIEQACDHFLSAVRAGRRLCARDALLTHQLCEEIVERADRTGSFMSRHHRA